MAEVISENQQWLAKHRYARISPQKARYVVDLIRGMPCQAALDTLRFNPRRAAVMVTNVLKSAMASANEAEANMNRLYVSEARVDAGPTMHRWRPKDRGRAHPIQKKMSHLVIGVSES